MPLGASGVFSALYDQIFIHMIENMMLIAKFPLIRLADAYDLFKLA